MNAWPRPQRLWFKGICRVTLTSAVFQSTLVIPRDSQIPGLADVQVPFQQPQAMIQADLGSPSLDHHILWAFGISVNAFIEQNVHLYIIIILYICTAHYCLRKKFNEHQLIQSSSQPLGVGSRQTSLFQLLSIFVQITYHLLTCHITGLFIFIVFPSSQNVSFIRTGIIVSFVHCWYIASTQ